MRKLLIITEEERRRILGMHNLSEQSKIGEEIFDIHRIMDFVKTNPDFLKVFESCIKDLKINFDPGPMISIFPPGDIKAKEWFDKMSEDVKRIMDCVKQKRPELYNKLKNK